MKSFWGFIILLVLSGMLLQSCTDQPVSVIQSQHVDYSSTFTIIYSKHIQPILTNNCLSYSCHNSINAASGLILDSWGSLFRGSRAGAVVVSGNSFMSHLMQVINTDTAISPVSFPQMPLGRNPLSKDQILLMRRWIDEGAENDAGEKPFSNPPRGKVYVTNQGADLVAVIDIETNMVMRYSKVGSQAGGSILGAPHNVGVDDSGKYYYVTLIQVGELWKFQASDDEYIGKINLGISPGHVVVSANGSTAYVTDYSLLGSSQGIVKVIDTRSMTMTATIPMGGLAKSPHGARLTHDGRRVFTANTLSSTVSVIRTSDNSVEAVIPLDPDAPPGTANLQPFQIAVHPDDRYIFVTCYRSSELNGDVRMIDLDSLKVTKVIPVGTRPIQVEITPNGQTLFVCNQGSDNVSVIATATNTVVATISNLPKQPHGVDFTEDGKTAYVTCENQIDPIPPHHPTLGLKTPAFVVVIDVATRQVIRKIEVGSYAAGVSVTPGKGN